MRFRPALVRGPVLRPPWFGQRPFARAGRRQHVPRRVLAPQRGLSALRRLLYAVGLYITAAYWFTASTSFANPAVTLARSLTDTFAGIAPINAPMFVVAEVAGALAAMQLMAWLLKPKRG